MLQKLRAVFASDKPATVAELLESKMEMEAEHGAAEARLSEVTREVNAALVEAIAAGDEKERVKLRKRITDAAAVVQELAAAIDGLDQRIETAKQIEAGNLLAMDSAERAQLAQEREDAAALMQKHLTAFSASYYSFFDIGRRIEAKLGTRTIRNKMQDRDFYLRAEIEQQLICRSPESLLGDRSMLGGFTVGEFMRDGRLLDLQEHVRRQNARLLSEPESLPKAA